MEGDSRFIFSLSQIVKTNHIRECVMGVTCSMHEFDEK